jgi:uncharacterized protein
MLALTDACPLRCDYCFVLKNPRRMSIETAHRAVDYLLSRPVSGGEYELAINFFGGEPFLEMEVMRQAIEYARKPRPNTYKKVRFYATTSGVIATPTVETLIKDAHMGLLVSLDGTETASRHRPFLSGRASYPVVAANLPKLSAWADGTTVRMTFHPETLDLVGNIRNVLGLGAESIALCPVLEADWETHRDALEAAYDALADWFLDEARQGRVLPLEVTRNLLQSWHRHLVGGEDRPLKPCGVGSWLIGIDPDGHVMPCHRFLYQPEHWLGTVQDPSISDGRWPYVHTTSADILGCDTCPARPVCGGGCRFVAMTAGQGLHGTHPGYCITTRAHARAARRIYDTLKAEHNPILAKILKTNAFFHPALSELAVR